MSVARPRFSHLLSRAGERGVGGDADPCRRCRYDVTRRLGEDACPFNAPSWDFTARNRDRLDGNPRMTMPYATLNKMDPGKLQALRRRARGFLDGPTSAEPGTW